MEPLPAPSRKDVKASKLCLNLFELKATDQSWLVYQITSKNISQFDLVSTYLTQ